MMWFYISFADHEGFRGGTIVQAENATGALAEATGRGLNTRLHQFFS
jgi:hypothetical protein